jgi:ABC-type Fe3+/spermidine/putrescine transport system ATPase subunit
LADSLIKLQDLKKEYDGTPVLRGISLDIKSREFVTLLGPSDCGKTTTLRIIGGVMLEDRKVEFCGREFECVDSGFGHNAPVDVVIRPEDLRLVYAGDDLLQGVVESIVFKGVHYEMMVRTEHFTFTVHSTMAEPVGKTVGLTVIPFDIHIMHKSAEAQA